MDICTPAARSGLARLAQFIRPELKVHVLRLAERDDVADLDALMNHPTFMEFAALSTMVNGRYAELPEQYQID